MLDLYDGNRSDDERYYRVRYKLLDREIYLL